MPRYGIRTPCLRCGMRKHDLRNRLKHAKCPPSGTWGTSPVYEDSQAAARLT